MFFSKFSNLNELKNENKLRNLKKEFCEFCLRRTNEITVDIYLSDSYKREAIDAYMKAIDFICNGGDMDLKTSGIIQSDLEKNLREKYAILLNDRREKTYNFKV